jgi:hypothetical protein
MTLGPLPPFGVDWNAVIIARQFEFSLQSRSRELIFKVEK